MEEVRLSKEMTEKKRERMRTLCPHEQDCLRDFLFILGPWHLAQCLLPIKKLSVNESYQLKYITHERTIDCLLPTKHFMHYFFAASYLPYKVDTILLTPCRWENSGPRARNQKANKGQDQDPNSVLWDSKVTIYLQLPHDQLSYYFTWFILKGLL